MKIKLFTDKNLQKTNNFLLSIGLKTKVTGLIIEVDEVGDWTKTFNETLYFLKNNAIDKYTWIKTK